MQRNLLMLVLIAFTLTPAALAEIELSIPDRSTYSLGDAIPVTATVAGDAAFNGFLNLAVVCGSDRLPFFLSQLSLEQGKEKPLQAGVKLSAPLEGTCKIKAELQSFDIRGQNFATIEEVESSPFSIDADATITVTLKKNRYGPGETIDVTGRVTKATGEPVDGAEIKLNVLDDDLNATVADGSFSFAVRLPDDVSSGKHKLFFYLEDAYGNEGDATTEFEVESIPTSIAIELNKNSYEPGEIARVRPFLLDHARHVMDAPVQLKITGPQGKAITRESIPSGSDYLFKFESSAPAGAYIITVSYEGLSQEVKVDLPTVGHLEAVLDGGAIIIRNTGNAQHDEQVQLIIANEEEEKVITEKVSLSPLEAAAVSLEGKVDAGIYNVTLLFADAETPVAAQAYIDPQQKPSDLAAVTGASISSGAAGGSSGTVAVAFLIVVILGALGYYNRKRIARAAPVVKERLFGLSSGSRQMGDSHESRAKGSARHGQQETAPEITQEMIDDLLEKKS